MTLKVSPEDLGPLTVRAHIDAAGIRIELFAPGEAAREAVRHILPELRKGLEDSGASLSLSSQNSPADPGKEGRDPGQPQDGRDPGQHQDGQPQNGHPRGAHVNALGTGTGTGTGAGPGARGPVARGGRVGDVASDDQPPDTAQPLPGVVPDTWSHQRLDILV